MNVKCHEEIELLVEENIDLVLKINSGFWNCDIDEQERLSASSSALWNAAITWNKNGDFRGWATTKIKWAIGDLFKYYAKVKRGGGITRVSFDCPVADYSELTIGNVLVDTKNKHPDDECAISNDVQIILSMINKLSKLEQNIIEKFFGLGEYERHTQLEIAQQLNITESRVCQIKQGAVFKLKQLSNL